MIKYKNDIHDPNLLTIAINSLSLKFLQFIWEATCIGDGNQMKNNLSILKSLANKNKSSSNSAHKTKRKSILIQNVQGASNFNGGKHSITISDLIKIFCKKKDNDAIT